MDSGKKQSNDLSKTVDIGNASNAGPQDDRFTPAEGEHQVLGKEAEKYLRQVTSPEEMPDAEERQDLDGKQND